MTREQESQSFSLSITFSDGKWTVVMKVWRKARGLSGEESRHGGLASTGALVGTDDLMNQTGVFEGMVLFLNQRVQGSSPRR